MLSRQGWNFQNSYARLPEPFYKKVMPVPVRDPHLVLLNETLAEELGLDFKAMPEEDLAAIFSGNAMPDGADPLAQAYAGHQFGHFNRLGDGRAILLGEHLTPTGERFDIQLKGSGKTPYSRRGDGRAALGPMLREYIISEAMFALGIPTTRSLAVVTTGEPVYRETVLQGAVLTRIASSHIRVGTFEYAASLNDISLLKALADYTIERHYPELDTGQAGTEKLYLNFLNAVIDRQAKLVSLWMQAGFIHGVMNTDNMAICGETIDYGPCAFMDSYDPLTVFSSIDENGRYAYGNQPLIAQWNLARFAETLLPLFEGRALEKSGKETDQISDQAIQYAEEAVDSFGSRFQAYWLLSMRQKLGLFNETTDDLPLIRDLLDWMRKKQVDYTNVFRHLCSDTEMNAHSFQDQAFKDQAFQDWYQRWQTRLDQNSRPRAEAFDWMRKTNPVLIPRNHLVEEALRAATEEGDLQNLKDLILALQNPYDDLPEHSPYRASAPAGQGRYQTFCGT